MRALAILLASLSFLLSATAQGTVNFRVTLSGDQVVPPSGSGFTAQGDFTLNGSKLFMGSIFIPGPTVTLSVHGPGSSGSFAPVLFDFTPGGTVGPGPNGEPGGQQFTVSRTLTVTEADQLNANLWYLSAGNLDFPNGMIRGQITAVPEPSSVALLGVGGVTCYLARRKKAKSI